MTDALTLITQDIYGMKATFDEVSVDKSITFEREASFAIQVIGGNTYMLGVAKGNRQSVVDAVTNVSAIGISLNPARRQAYLVPRKNKVCLDISYMGLIDLATATGSIRWAQAAVVHANDEFTLNGFDQAPTHKYKPFDPLRGDVVGVYVVVKTADGDFLTHPMAIGDVYAIRDRSEAWKAYLRDESKRCPWNTDEAEMIKKTCVKQAYKYWPKTERLEKAIHYLNNEAGEGLADPAVNGGPTDAIEPTGRKPAVAMPQSTDDAQDAPFRDSTTQAQQPKQEQQPQRPPAGAPAPQRQAAPAAPSQACSPGEVKWVMNKLERLGLGIGDGLQKAGIEGRATLDGLNKAEFALLRGALV